MTRGGEKQEFMDEFADLRQTVESLTWVHSIDLGNGIVTKGEWGAPNPLILDAFSAIDFNGKKVLDIGCWDGLWSFQAEARGAAEVYATDYLPDRWGGSSTFSLCHKVLNSKARYYPNVSVYALNQQLDIRDFDIVIFCGIYYHLKHPLLALSRIREVMKTGAILILEGEAIYNFDEPYARFFYRKYHVGDRSNWWVPTVACLREWVECSFFEIINEYKPPEDTMRGPLIKSFLKNIIKSRLRIKVPETFKRYVLTARSVCRKDSNYVYLDEDLKKFDLNKYPHRNR